MVSTYRRFVLLVSLLAVLATAFEIKTTLVRQHNSRHGRTSSILLARSSLANSECMVKPPINDRTNSFGGCLSESQMTTVRRHLTECGLWEENGGDDEHDENCGKGDSIMTRSSASQLLFLAQDFVDRPESFSTILINDFQLPALVAHQTRAMVMAVLKQQREDANLQRCMALPSPQDTSQSMDPYPATDRLLEAADKEPIVTDACLPSKRLTAATTSAVQQPKKKKFSHMKNVIVNQKSKQRREQTGDDFEYALPSNYEQRYPLLASELQSFYKFMTQPSTLSQEPPIRDATANVYQRHARLFLGYYINVYGKSNGNGEEEQGTVGLRDTKDEELSIFHIIPNKEKESASIIIEFIQWLRTHRNASVSYEANLLRGLIKMLKYRFAEESESEAERNTFDDIAIIKEVRKLHRYANQRTKLAPRSSNEDQKWITWPEFLHVAECTKQELWKLVEDFKNIEPKDEKDPKYCARQRKVADAFQRWLILAIFANIPDRQRTIREMEIGRTLVKDYSNDEGIGYSWIVKHGPEDYKTGSSYGERPAMQLSPELSPAVDDFIENWRPSLSPTTNFLFVQAKTGNPMTADSIFQRVSRCCFKHTGKRTNPHLLRDMLVTHVRSSGASENELEALALYMGHSIHMQRTSYDRRSLSSKVAPAVKLMQTVNAI